MIKTDQQMSLIHTVSCVVMYNLLLFKQDKVENTLSFVVFGGNYCIVFINYLFLMNSKSNSAVLATFLFFPPSREIYIFSRRLTHVIRDISVGEKRMDALWAQRRQRPYLDGHVFFTPMK